MASLADVHDGLEGVLAFATEIAEPDRDGGALRYRGDRRGAAGRDAAVRGRLGAAGRRPPRAPLCSPPDRTRCRCTPATCGSTCRRLSPRWRPIWGSARLSTRQRPRRSRPAGADLGRGALEFVAQSARGVDLPPVPESAVDAGGTLAERFLLRWRGEADPRQAAAIDAYWITAAEHGMNASTFTARVIASTGADAAAALAPRSERCRARCTAAPPRAC